MALFHQHLAQADVGLLGTCESITAVIAWTRRLAWWSKLAWLVAGRSSVERGLASLEPNSASKVG